MSERVHEKTGQSTLHGGFIYTPHCRRDNHESRVPGTHTRSEQTFGHLLHEHK